MTLRFHKDAFSFLMDPIQCPDTLDALDMKQGSDGVWRLDKSKRPRMYTSGADYMEDRVTGIKIHFVIVDEPSYVSFEECDAYFQSRRADIAGTRRLPDRTKTDTE